MFASPGRKRGQQGAVLLELIVSSLAASVVLAALVSAAISIRRSITATDQFAANSANQARVIDYLAQDLRRAVRVGMLTGGTETALKNFNNFAITETNVLTITVPDYYATNTPNNAFGSTFKTSRYPRATLNTAGPYNGNATPSLNGIIPWADAVMTVGNKQITRFSPPSAGSGEIQIRYYRGPRSVSDPSPCYFRAEYPPGATVPSQTREIAERIEDNLSTTNLLVTGKNAGQVFRLQSNFKPRYRSQGATSTGTDAFVEVTVRNLRRD
jgi:hypothetical protein